MKKTVFICVISLLLICSTAGLAEQGKLVAPPPVHLPYGAKVVTELNFSNADVLGLIREMLPAMTDLVKLIASSGIDFSNPSGMRIPPEAVSKLDFSPLSEAIEGITNLRILVANYRHPQSSGDVTSFFDAAAAKAGAASKIMSDASNSLMPGAAALYALPDGGGYIGYAYDAARGRLVAGRVNGKVDVARLVKWAGETAKTLFLAATSPQPDASEPQPDGSEEPKPSEEAAE